MSLATSTSSPRQISSFCCDVHFVYLLCTLNLVSFAGQAGSLRVAPDSLVGALPLVAYPATTKDSERQRRNGEQAGKCPLLLIVGRYWRCSASIVLMVQTARRTSAGRAGKGLRAPKLHARSCRSSASARPTRDRRARALGLRRRVDGDGGADRLWVVGDLAAMLVPASSSWSRRPPRKPQHDLHVCCAVQLRYFLRSVNLVSLRSKALPEPPPDTP